MVPVVALRDKPVGNAPEEIDQVCVPVPPEEVQVKGVIRTVRAIPVEGTQAAMDNAGATVLLKLPVLAFCGTEPLSVTLTV